MEIKTIPLSEDLLDAAFSHLSDKTLMIFPTRRAAGVASRRFISDWKLQEASFISMEDFMDACILPSAPVLMDEKRLLCLYLVMGEENREFFHILQYADIVEWGRKFFDFFEELSDEEVDVESLDDLKNSGVFYLQMWQETYLERIQQIRRDYFNYISALGFTDKMFYLHKESIYIPWQNYRIVFVNQYYYSKLEVTLIHALEEAGNEVSVLYHGLEPEIRGASWKPKEFNLEAAWQELKRKPKISIVESTDEDQMALSFLAWLKSDGSDSGGAVIDSSFHQKAYSRYFSPERFKLPKVIRITETALFGMLQAILAGVKAWRLSGAYLPLSLMAKLYSVDWFLPYFVDGLSKEQEKNIKLSLDRLLKNDYLYLDMQVFAEDPNSMPAQVISKYIMLIQRFADVNSIKELCDLIDAPQGLVTDRLISKAEREYTDIQACFWERLANFASIDSMGIVPAWTEIFSPEERGEGILELFIGFLKSATISYKEVGEIRANWEISNLLDARNRRFDKLAFFQMIEGVLPSNPSPVWLFNETQRGKLGLKSYTDIRAWERYYFFRVLLVSKETACFCYRNVERDVSPSSFLGELEQLIGFGENLDKCQVQIQIKEVLYNPDVKASKLLPKPKEIDENFFILPCQPTKDIRAHNTLFLSASAMIQFIKNPFIWYIENHSRLQSIPYEAEEIISNKLFGNIMHAYFARILGSERGEHHGLDRLEAILGNPLYLQEGLVKLLQSGDFRYQIPKNYNAEFLSEIISVRLAESLNAFFENWVQRNLDKRSFTLIPEEEEMTHTERSYKTLGSVLHEGKEYHIALHGKADLRIETEDEAMIIDFKTGNRDYRQLIIYEWFYYLLGESMPEEKLSSLFWNILDMKDTQDRITPDKRYKLKQDVLDTLQACLERGYYQGKKTTDRLRLKSITRADLLTAALEQTNE